VDGDESHGVLVALQAELMLLRRERRVSLFGKPLQQSGHVQLFLYRGLMQDFHEMEKIRVSSLPVGKSNQTGQDFSSLRKSGTCGRTLFPARGHGAP